MTMTYALAVEAPVPSNELNAVFALDAGQHNVIEICQHLVAVLQTVGFQKGRRLHLPHILRCGPDNLIHLVLGIDPFRLVDILIAVGNAAVLGHLTQRRTIKQDTQPAGISSVCVKPFSGKDDRGLSEVTVLFFCADAHITPPVCKKIRPERSCSGPQIQALAKRICQKVENARFESGQTL